MKPSQMILLLFGCSLGGGLIGTPIGWVIGKVSPGFVSGLFGGPNYFFEDPAQTGLGLGMVNGIIFGLLIGAFVIIMTVVRERRGG